MSTRRRHLSRTAAMQVVIGALVVLVLAACGSQDSTAKDASEGSGDSSSSPAPSSSESPETEAASAPECGAVWVDGQDLPVDYEGCTEDGVVVKPKSRMCGFGRPLVTHDGRFYAMPGNRINDEGDLKTSRDYKSAKKACLA